MLRLAREFFAVRSALEVETPALGRCGVSDPHIASLSTRVKACGNHAYYLQTSPEYSMKRLLAAGTPDIFQICRVFRDREIGAMHQPEFTLVEWYRRGATLEEMIGETCAFIFEVCELTSMPVDTYHYRDLFLDLCGIDPLEADAGRLADSAGRLIDSLTTAVHRHIGADRQAWLDLLMTHVVIPGLAPDRLSVVHHFPADQAALARLDPADPEFAERFEVFHGDLELANGYRELTDSAEQRRRFERDNERRSAAGLPLMEPDRGLLAALDHGLPECSGVAVGFDRLVMTACGLRHINDAVSFAH